MLQMLHNCRHPIKKHMSRLQAVHNDNRVTIEMTDLQ